MLRGMRYIFKFLLFLLVSWGSIISINAQGARCDNIEPFCAGEERLTFPNSNSTNSNVVSGEIGPDYGCLVEQPYPAWFFLQVETAGDLEFKISQYQNENGTGAALDVDFVVWGPFDRGEEYCNGLSLNSERIVDCSYLPDAVETMSIPDAQVNKIYVVVITNFESTPGFISLQQTNTGNGSTDCSILGLGLGDFIKVCDENQYTFDAGVEGDLRYEWFLFNDETSEYEIIPGENERTLTVEESGDYKLVVTDIVEKKIETDEVTIEFYDSPPISSIEMLSACQNNTESIDLTIISSDLIGSDSNSGRYEVLFYDSQQNIEEESPIEFPESYPFEIDKILYARVRDRLSDCVSEPEEFKLGIFDFPEYTLPETTIFCVDQNNKLLQSRSLGLDLGSDYEYEWYDGDQLISTSAIVTFTEDPPQSDLRVVVSHKESKCELAFTTNAVPVSKPAILSIEISGSDFGDGYTVTANPEDFIGEDFAEFEYRLDNGSWQERNTFSEVPPGSHVITAREINGCGKITSESFFLVGYPRFFSPNSDGYNDTWKLITDNFITIKKLYIFDRYGKIIRELDPNLEKGWDGTFNGTPLPADDYWFRIEFVDEKTGDHREYMANFTLIR